MVLKAKAAIDSGEKPCSDRCVIKLYLALSVAQRENEVKDVRSLLEWRVTPNELVAKIDARMESRVT